MVGCGHLESTLWIIEVRDGENDRAQDNTPQRTVVATKPSDGVEVLAVNVGHVDAFAKKA